ncbi:MAG: DUF6351 family protein, partial [Acidimicrobiia bacterium]|nr:DUF6351 family protein [Acidimicrobiia bacterium]
MRPRLLTTFVAVALFASACVDDAIPPGNLADEVATTTTSPAGEGAGAPSPDDPVITVVSSDPGLITGGDALIRVDNPGATTIVRLNGNDVTASFGTTADGAIEGVVTGMGLGANSLAV